ncbi:MAG: hypothetical protein ISS19_10705 [Bacteroidales bacterium]|nr:hypothetical protein [Bacteroidales bacterium]
MNKVNTPPYAIDRERWERLTILEQMGNIGSEVGRTLKLKQRGDNFEPALIRALDLFDATVELLISKKSYRTREVLRAKDQFLQALYVHDDPSIESYFMKFAIAARNKR